MNDCRASYTHRFDTCIVCIKQGDEGGGLVTKYSRGAGTCMYMWYPRHSSDDIEVHTDMYKECRGRKPGGSVGMPPPRKNSSF